MDGSLHLPLTAGRARSRGARPTRRLVALKQHRGNHAFGLILLGFLLGVAATIAVMMQMDPRPAPPPGPATASEPAKVASPVYAPIQLQALHTAASPATAVAGSPPAIIALPGGPPPRAVKTPRKAPAPAAPGVLTAEDAAATGMTARRRSTSVQVDQLF